MKYKDNLGAQLYTVREHLGPQAASTIEKIAEIGYREVELHDLSQADQLAPLLKMNGLRLIASHFWPAYITGQWDVLSMFGLPIPEQTSFDFVIEQAQKHEIPNVVIPMLFPQERGNIAHYKVLAEQFNIYGEKCKAAGLQFCYHNHAFELEPMEGTTPLQTLIDFTDRDLVSFELDAFWVAITQTDPVSTIEQYGDRIRILHIKDLKAGTPPTYSAIQTSIETPEVFKPIGQGTLDFDAILSAAAEAQIQHCMVELDFTEGDPVDSLQSSFEFLTTKGPIVTGS